MKVIRDYCLVVARCCFLLFISSFAAYSQDNKSAKIKEIDSVLLLSRQAQARVDVYKSLDYALEAKVLSEKHDYSEGRAKSYFYCAQALLSKGGYDKALEYLSKSEQEKFTKEIPLMLSEVYRVRGRTYVHMGLYDWAIKEFEKGLVHIKKTKDAQLVDSYSSLNYENLSQAYRSKDAWDSVYYYVAKNKAILDSRDEVSVSLNLVNMHGLIGEYYAKSQKYDSAMVHFNKSLSIAHKHKVPYTSSVLRHMGNMELENGNTDEALGYYTRAKNNLDTTGIKNEISLVYRAFVSAYEAKNNIDSLDYYKHRAALVDNELANETVMASKKALDIILKEERKNKKEETVKILIITGAILLVVCLGLLFYILKYRQKSQLLSEKEGEALELKQKVNDAFADILTLAKNNDPAFSMRFAEVYPEFVHELTRRYPELSNTEISLCAMIFLNFSSKEIAKYTFLEHRSVQTKKNRLRKKLSLSPDIDLHQYFHSF